MAENLTQRVLQLIIEAKNQTTEGLDAAAADLTGFRATVGDIGKSLALVGAGMLTAGVAIGGVMAGLVDVAARFDASLVNVQNNTNMSDAGVQAMKETVLSLGQETGASFDSLTQGFMHVMNITGDVTASQIELKVATESAISTGGDAATTANVLANAMHEYGLDVSNAATAQQRQADITANATRVMGVMHLAAAESNMTLEQFSESSGKMIGIAANLGIPIEQVSAAFAALTKHGYDAAQAQTQMVDLMTKIQNPTKAAEDAIIGLTKATGVDLKSDFSAAGLSAKGLDGVLGDLKTAFQRMGYSQAEATGESMKLINAQRGGLGLASLLGTAWNDNNRILKDLTNTQLVNNVTQDSYNRTTQTLAFQVSVLKNQIEATAITIGEALEPSVQRIVAAIGPVLQEVGDWAKAHADLIAQILPGVAVFLSVAGTILMLTGVIGILIAAVNPLTLAIGAMVAVGAALYFAWSTNFLGLRDTLTQVAADILGTFDAITGGISALWTNFQNGLQGILNTVESFGQNIYSALSYLNPLRSIRRRSSPR